jgi:probable DNA repair protein
VRDFSRWLREGHAARRLEDARLPRLLGEPDERELWRAAIESSGMGADILDPAGAVRAARRARRTLHEHAIPPEAIAREAALSEELGAFLEWNRVFEQRCRGLDCIDAAELIGAPPAAPGPVAWIDTPAWRPAARRWLERHGKRLEPAMVAPSTAGRVHFTSQAGELASIAEWAAKGLRAAERFRAWICIPGLEQRRAEVVDVFDAALAPQRFGLSAASGAAPYAVAGGVPLSDFAPVRAALELLDASLGGVSLPQFSRMLRAPELQASDAEAGVAATLDIELRARGSAEAGLAEWLTLAERLAGTRELGAVGALTRLGAAQRALEELRGSRPVSRWIPAWIAAFDAAPWSLRERWSSVEYQAAERFRELLAELAAADAIFGSQSRRSAQGILRRAAAETVFQEQTGVPRIAVSGQLMDPFLPYGGLWIAGCTEERWPPRPDPTPLLPVRLQREFGVLAASADSQLRHAEDLQARWVARAHECVFSLADPGDGRSATPSPLLPRAAAEVAAAEPEPHWHALRASAPVLERIVDERAPPFSAEERARGVTALQAQSRCAFRGFAEARLRCERLERPVPGFNDRERGEMVHHALEHLWTVLGDSDRLHALAAEEQAASIAQSVARAVARQVRKRDPGPRWRERERERLERLLARWLDLERQRLPFTVERIEHEERVLRFAGLDFAVRLDRMDRLADGARILLDYKTGSAAADWRGDRPDNPQLPVYALLHPSNLVAVAYAKVNAADLDFIAETEREAVFRPAGRRSKLEGQTDFPALIALWEQRVEALARAFSAGHAEVAPTLSACKTCRLQGLCRVPAALGEGTSDD